MTATGLRYLTRRRSAGIAHRAVVLDGRTLNVDIELWNDPAGPIEVILTCGMGGNPLLVQAVIARGHHRFTAVAVLDSTGLDLGPGAWSVGVRVGSSIRPLLYEPRGEANTETIRPDPPDDTDGVVRRPVATPTGALGLQVTSPRPSAHVEVVDTTLYRMIVEIRPVVTEITGAELQLRGTNATVPVPIRYINGRSILDIPLAELSECPDLPDGRATNVWNIICDTESGRIRPTRSLSDLRNPRGSVRYDTVVLAVHEDREQFRPYWTTGGSLVVEHRRPGEDLPPGP